MLSRNASCPVEFVLKNVTPVPLPVPSGFVRLSKTKVIVAFSSPSTDVVVVVVVLPVVEADTRVVVDAKIIVSVKIVATRWMLRSRGIFLLRLISIPILLTFQERSKG